MGAILAGRYELVALRAAGSFGAVYLARDSFLSEKVALKVFAPKRELSLDDVFGRVLSDLREEAKASVRLAHPHVARVSNYERDVGGWEFLVMEYIEGPDLQSHLEKTKSGRLNPDVLLEVGAQIGRALVYAHGQGVLHLDIKPSNILRCRPGLYKLCDFGLAPLTELLPKIAPGAVFGTFAFMAPEIAKGEVRVDRRADVYSLAATLFTLGHGKPPFGRGKDALRGHASTPIPLSPHIPQPLMDVIARGLRKDPERRFGSTDAFLEAWTAAGRQLSTELDSAASAAPRRPKDQTMGRTVTSPMNLGVRPKRVFYDPGTQRWEGFSQEDDSPSTLVIAFAAREYSDELTPLRELARAYPKSCVIGCSTAGEVHEGEVLDGSISATVMKFEHTALRSVNVFVRAAERSRTAGEAIGRKLQSEDLRAVFVLASGLNVNGTDLAAGLNSAVGEGVVVVGGLAGDGSRFERTWAMSGLVVDEGVIVAVGLYGDHLVIGHGSQGGWDPFGPQRVITKATDNVLYEIDGEPALDLYERYLGPQASELPASGLLFPLAMRRSAESDVLVRTLLAVDRDQRSLTFAGDVPKGATVQMMKADFDRLVDGASGATLSAGKMLVGHDGPCLAIAVSCVGRRLVLGERVEDELEAVQERLPVSSVLTGFYSYGELSPLVDGGPCALHNQTMTLTVLCERDPLAAEAGAPLQGATDEGSTVTRLAREPAAVPTARAGGRRPPPSPPVASPPIASPPIASPPIASPPIASPSISTRPSPPPPPRPPRAAGRHETQVGETKVAQFSYDLQSQRWSEPEFPRLDSENSLVLVFGAPEVRGTPKPITELVRAYPRSHIIGCSSSGEVHGEELRDNSLSVIVVKFRKTKLARVAIEARSSAHSFSAGQALARRLLKPGLRWVFVLSEGLNVNGTQLARGLSSVLPDDVVCTGGLAGDGDRFGETWVLNGGKLDKNIVAAVGFYGDHLAVGHGSLGGWDPFGPMRTVTHAEDNVVFTLDDVPALDLYEQYLGEQAAGLPATGLLFPLALNDPKQPNKTLVRTLLAVDKNARSMTFAGDLPVGSTVQLMKADFERLVDGASGAASQALESMAGLQSLRGPVVGLAVSCVGRRLVLGERTEDELEAVQELLPDGATVAGFYSYGELSPLVDSTDCELHNQTMTLTVFGESMVPLPRPKKPQAAPNPPIAAPNASIDTIVAAPPPPVPVPVPASTTAPAAVEHGSTAYADTVLTEVTRPDRLPEVVLPPGTLVPGLGLEVVERQAAGTTVLSFRGRMSETFRGDEVASRMGPTVVLDLAGVDRITSFGVREWLQMMKAAAARVTSVYFVGCSEALVNQFNMIRPFAGEGTMVSLFAPMRCPTCDLSFRVLLPCTTGSIGGSAAPGASCPSCSNAARLDEDASSYFATARRHAQRVVPPDVLAIADALDTFDENLEVDLPPIEKVLEDEATLILVRGPLDAPRWSAVFDGVEGDLIMDLSSVSAFAPTSVSALGEGLGRLGSEVPRILIRGTSSDLRQALSGSVPAKTLFGSSFPARTEVGQAPARPVHGDTDRRTRFPVLAGAALLGVGALAIASWQFFGTSTSSEDQTEAVAPTSAPEERTDDALPGRAPSARDERSPAVTPDETTAQPRPQTEVAPAWTESRFSTKDGNAFFVASASAETEQEAVSLARIGAYEVLAETIHAELRGTEIYDLVQARRESVPTLTGEQGKRLEEYLAGQRDLTNPSRVDVYSQTTSDGVRAFVKYELPEAELASWVERFEKTHGFYGLSVANLPPFLAGLEPVDGGVIVLSSRQRSTMDRLDLRKGDRILKVNGRYADDIGAFKSVMAKEWADTESGRSISFDVVVSGVKKSITMRKPR